MSGILKLAEALPHSQLTSLRSVKTALERRLGLAPSTVTTRNIASSLCPPMSCPCPPRIIVISSPFPRHFLATSSPLPRHFLATSSPLPRHFRPVSSPYPPCVFRVLPLRVILMSSAT